MIVVAILGILAVVAVPALQKYLRRAKTAEAKTQIAKLYDHTSASYVWAHNLVTLHYSDDETDILSASSFGSRSSWS